MKHPHGYSASAQSYWSGAIVSRETSVLRPLICGPLKLFKVEDDSTNFVSSPLLAWACIRLDRLRNGYRFVRLMDSRGCPVEGGKLLVKVEKTIA
ncbi:hypothetical protein BGZ61DRAFT_184800 [Ilyonectria robusta]|uniref:uncharacterized protein n=1 Tax=Ilyonectria robusta TaxID=1079257 RepID=UPI001E8EACF6|nr:uncharacterized protein BGZ61DRAFT_184800 [Ilyonectria robusta]KAH8729607.1 hypothetical protein BGZ61DRAFT_184800 [Ilyonectria robusta]